MAGLVPAIHVFRGFPLLTELAVVMRGLDPRIHLFQEMMDCRVKPGNDAGAKHNDFISRFEKADSHHDHRRPREGGDPDSVSLMMLAALVIFGGHHADHDRQGLWVPACAGTTQCF